MVDAGSIYSEVRVRLDKLKGDITQMNSLFDRVNTGTKKTGKQVKQTSLVAVAAFAAIGIAIKKLVGGSIKLFAGFEQSLANVASVAGATAEEFTDIRDAALEAGETTRFTATQAGDALYFLASAGFSAAQSIDALDGVLNLAGATQSDLAFTSAAVASTISQFNLEAEEATKVANVFTAAITNSQATMDKLATSLRFVGPVASAFGLSLEEVTGGLQILFNAGFEASTAGTALRSALADLSNEAGPAVAKLNKLGVSFSDINPATNSFAEIIGVLSEKVSEGGDILNVFGDRAGPALIKLIQAGQSSIEEYTAAVTDTNAAAEAYAIQNDTLAGSLDRLKSASESARIKFGELIGKALRPLIDLFTKIIAKIAKLPDFFKILFGVLVIGIPAVIAVTVAIQALIPTLIALGTTIAAVALPITAVVGGIALLTAGIVGIVRAADKADLRKVKLEFGDLAEQLDITAEEMQDLVKATRAMGEVTDESLKKMNDFRISLGLTTEELKKLNRQAKLFGVDAEAFAIAKTELGLTTIEVKRLESAYTAAAIRILKGSTEAADEVEVLANKYSLTEEQVLKYLLANDRVTGSVRDQLQLIDDQARKAAELKAGYEEYAEGRIAASEEIKRVEEEITRELEKQQGIEKSANEIFLEREAIARNRRDETFRQTEELSKAGLVNEVDRLQARLTAWETYLNTITSGSIGFANAESASFQLAVENIKVLREQLELLNKESDAADNYGKSIQSNTDKINSGREASFQANQEQIDGIKNTQEKIEDLGKSELELIEIQRQRAIEAIEASEADIVFKDAAIAALNEYYDLLEDDTANQKFIENLTNATDKIKSIFDQTISALSDLNKSAVEKELELLDTQLEAAIEAAGVAEETKRESLERQLSDAQAEGDAENIKAAEDAITRYDITSGFEKQKADIEYQGELSSWRLKVAAAIASAAQAVIVNFAQLGLIGGLIANAAMAIPIGIEAAALDAAKPKAPSFQTGGMVIGSGSSAGSSVNVAENGSNELLLNNGSSGRAFLNEFADLINQRGGGGNITLQMYIDSKLMATATAPWFNNGIIRLDV